jgi:hypothetical protein
MKKLLVLTAVVAAAALVACGSSSSSSGFPRPAGTIAVGVTVNDTANHVFSDGQLEWKGSMMYDAVTRTVTKDTTWSGPWAPLYDDGPWTSGGHEPAGATAGDHIFGTVVFVTPPATGSDTYEYGMNDAVYQTNFGNGWIWPAGPNGTFAVAAGATADISASGLTLAAFGTKDAQLTIDVAAALAASNGPWDSAKITVKGSAWAWSEVTLCSSTTTACGTTGTKTFTLSDNVGTGKTFAHSGLLHSADKPEFIFVFNGKEYKTASGDAQTTGVTAGTRTGTTGSFAAATVAVYSKSGTPAGNGNTYITVP